MNRFRIGNNLAITWLLFENDGEIHNLEGKDLELYMTCAGYKYPVRDYTVTENCLAWTFPAALQTKTGFYKLVLVDRDEARGLCSFDINDAFVLVPKDSLENIRTIPSGDATLEVRSVLTYAHISNLATIDVAESPVTPGLSLVTFHLTNGKSFTIPFRSGSDVTYRIVDGDTLEISYDGEMGEGSSGEGGAMNILMRNNGTYVQVSYNGGEDWENLIALSQLKGKDGKEYTLQVASRSVLGGIRLGHTSSNENHYPLLLDDNNRAYVNVPVSGTGTSPSNPGGDGQPGRSVTGIDVWFKLSASSNVTAPAMSVADPSSSSGGSWSLRAGTPTESLPYLWAFVQVNYDKPLDSGYTYSRSSAYIARYFNSEMSAEFASLEALINSVRSDLMAEMSGYEQDLRALNATLEGLRTTIQNSIIADINSLKARFAQLDQTEVKVIIDEGLWSVLTGYVDDTNGQKSFSDIVLDAKQAKATLQTGSLFFGESQVGGSLTLDGILGQIAARATKQYVDSQIASAQFSVDPSALNSVIAKGQACWKKSGVLYPYDLYLADYFDDNSGATLAGYESYMESAYADGGPEGDSTRPGGPFELVVVVEQFSNIQQTVDGIAASVNTYRYMWDVGGQVYGYDAFQTNYAGYSGPYTYEQYVTYVIGGTKVEVGNVLSNVTLTSGRLRSIMGDMGYIWRKQNLDGSYSYQRYAVPSNTTRDDYVAAMQTAGWSLYDFSEKMSVIDQTDDKITLAVEHSVQVWIDEAQPATSAAYCRAYDYWQAEYEASSFIGTYEQYVSATYPAYVLTDYADNVSRIKQTAMQIESAVTAVDGIESRLSVVEQTAEQISLGVAKSYKAWKNAAGDIKEYGYFNDEWQAAQTSYTYESWVPIAKSYSLVEVATELSGLKIRSDKIWAGVKDANDDVSAAISIVAGLGTNSGKIVLDAANVEVNGTLAANTVNAGLVNADTGVVVSKINEATGLIDGTVILPGSITTDKLEANAVTAAKIAAGAITTEKIGAGTIKGWQIDAGTITADNLAAGLIVSGGLMTGGGQNILNTLIDSGKLNIYLGPIDPTDLTVNRRAAFGIDNGEVVLKFYDEQGQEMYNLGPGGIMKANGPINLPEWTKRRVIGSSGNRFAGNETINPSSATDAYKYDAGYRYSETAPNSGIYTKLYLNPYDMNTFGEKPEMDGDYLDAYVSRPTSAYYQEHRLPVGEYIVLPIEEDRTYGYSADAFRIGTVNNERTITTGLKAAFTENDGVYTLTGQVFDPNNPLP